MSLYSIDLNSDLGESYGAYKIGNDAEIIRLVSSANIACGLHAGDPLVMERAIISCVNSGVSIGAHPGYPDIQGFGRRELALSNLEASAYVRYQVGALISMTKSLGGRLSHVKLHGAMYNRAAIDKPFAKAICDGLAKIDDSLILLGLSGSVMIDAARDAGLRAVNEVFADRAYMDDGTLVPRSKQGSMITDKASMLKRVIKMVVAREVETITGKTIGIQADSICVHGDGKQALDFISALRDAFFENKIEIKGLSLI